MRHLLYLARGCCHLAMLGAVALAIIWHDMALFAAICAILAMILWSMAEEARDRAMETRMVNRLAAIVQTAKEASMLEIDQALDSQARRRRASAETLADERTE